MKGYTQQGSGNLSKQLEVTESATNTLPIPRLGQPGEGWLSAKGCMGSVAVVGMEPWPHDAGTLGGILSPQSGTS